MSLNRQDSAQDDNLGRDGEKLHESSHLPSLASEYATVSQNTHSWSLLLSFSQAIVLYDENCYLRLF